MIAAPSVVIAVAGPAGHGVVRHARAIAALTASRPVPLGGGLPVDVATDVVHVHYTDRLFGPDAASAAAAFCELTASVRDRLAVTLHDVPLLDGTPHMARRAAAYREVAATAAALIVSSQHERDRLASLDIDGAVDVIRLPIFVRRARRPACALVRRPKPRAAIRTDWPADATVGVLGFVYPGKGHETVIDAIAGTGARVLAIGAPSPGHDDLVGALDRRAAAAGCPLRVTGPVDDRRLDVLLTCVDVPVAPAPAPSASASLARWIGAGRRPLALAGDYVDEVAAIGPHLITRYQAGDLRSAIARAVVAPGSTRRRGAIPAAMRPSTVGRLHRAVYERVAGGTRRG